MFKKLREVNNCTQTDKNLKNKHQAQTTKIENTIKNLDNELLDEFNDFEDVKKEDKPKAKIM
jgi:hypothetical protein